MAEKTDPMNPEPTHRFCPLLSLSALMSPPAMDEGDDDEEGGAQTANVIPCAGMNCAWFIPMHTPEGKLSGGGCAVTMIPSVIDTVGGALLASRGPNGPRLVPPRG